jgi:hypothetical protein
MIQNFGSNPKINCNATTEVVMTIGLRCLIHTILIAARRAATAGFRFFGIDGDAVDSRVA